MTSNFYALILLVASLALAACDGGSVAGDTPSSTSTSGSSAGSTSGSGTGSTSGSGTGSTTATPTIFGTPADSVIVGAAYTFSPGTTGTEGGGTLIFSIRNQPAWTTFDSATGVLSGTPTSSDIGTFAKIEISVSDGGSSVALAPFSITVVRAAAAAVTLSWMPPRENTNGTSATNLVGYRIYYGSTAKNLSQVITVEGGKTTFVFDQLPTGTWYFAVAAFNSEQVESDLSVVVPLKLGG